MYVQPPGMKKPEFISFVAFCRSSALLGSHDGFDVLSLMNLLRNRLPSDPVDITKSASGACFTLVNPSNDQVSKLWL